MLRWLLVLFVALVFISWLTPFLSKLGFGKLPGDLRFRLFGRDWWLPFTSTVLLSVVASVVSHYL
jgi:hypothetical protein